jgi:predicted helicase
MSIYSIKQYRDEVEKIIHYGGTKKETAIRSAFYNLLNEYAKAKGLMLITEVSVMGTKGRSVTPDGVLKDTLRQDWGYWESKDEADVLADEIKKKFDKGYPKDNILFEDSQTAILIQNGAEVLRASIEDTEDFDHLLTTFVTFERPEVKNFRKAIELFKEDIPKVTETLRTLILAQEKSNTKFTKAENVFLKLCQDSINPDVTRDDVREMIIQHILTEDIFNTIFDETQFHRENNIAHQLEGVINTFFTGQIRRTALGSMLHYYQAINAAAASIADHHEKQKFLKVVYETFYKSYNPKAADRLGVVYTPNEIVRFMIESTDYLLHHHFNKRLEDKGVEILDPATGTGTFICDIIDYIGKSKIEYKYANELHANEVAILPYYISNLNIEFTYKQKTGQYKEFENICFVDTLDNLGFGFAGKQTDMFDSITEENTLRIKRQNEKKISVVIGNPPYNAKQENYNYQNSNKAYAGVDKRIKETYIKHGTAQNQIVVYDMYTRFYRWAMDRLQNNGIIALITNRSFIDSRAFDGFRKSIQDEFDYCYIIDTKSDVRANPKISGTGHNVFGIQTGVAVMFLVRKEERENKTCQIQYISFDDFWPKEQKLQWFTENTLQKIPFEHINPSKRNNWINLADNDFETLLPVIDKDVKAGKSEKAIFKNFSRGVATQRDEWVYDLSAKDLETKVKYMIDIYSKTLVNPKNKDKHLIKWDRELDKYLVRKIEKDFSKHQINKALYRPYFSQLLYFDKNFNGMTYQWFDIYNPKDSTNKFVVVPGSASPKDFHTLCSSSIIDLNCFPAGGQCLPLYRYTDAGERVENITDWGLEQFCNHYGFRPAKKPEMEGSENKLPDNAIDPAPEFSQYHLKDNEKQAFHEPEGVYGKPEITKEDVFHYVYAVLHHPAYRKKYELNLKRDFPRIPFYDDFFKWADWGKTLMALHIDYETVAPFGLKTINSKEPKEQPKAKLKADKETGEIVLDENTTLSGVPAIAWEYKLGNRSALEWVLDQYKESKPKDPTIAEKFNTYRFADYKKQVIDLLNRVCSVSVQTMEIINQMPE